MLLLVLLFVLATVFWFWRENQARSLGFVEVGSNQEQVQGKPEQHPAPGLLDQERININTASLEDLCRLPGIGKVRAKDIIAYREQEGGFVVVEDLLAVSGIGEKTLEKLRPYLTVDG